MYTTLDIIPYKIYQLQITYNKQGIISRKFLSNNFTSRWTPDLTDEIT